MGWLVGGWQQDQGKEAIFGLPEGISWRDAFWKMEIEDGRGSGGSLAC